jgi:hypothetical protein
LIERSRNDPPPIDRRTNDAVYHWIGIRMHC